MQARKSQRSVLALVITCALILGFGIPLIPLVGVDSAEGTEVSAASDVATVSAENSLQNGSFEQPAVYQYRETSDVPYWKSTTTSGNIEIGSVFKNGNGDNDSLHMRTGEKVAAAEGSQFGKPATSNGNYSIYQRLATTQGAKYRWSLKHRARPSGSKSGFDTLAVITAPTMAPNRHRSHGVAAPTCSTTCSSGCSATVGTAPAGPSPTAASSTSTRATDGTNTKENSRRTATTPYSRWRLQHAQRQPRIRQSRGRRVRCHGRRRRRQPRDQRRFRIAIAYQGRRNGLRQRSSQRRNAAARTPHHAADWPHSLSPSQSANKRRLASLTGSAIALPYFVPRKSVPGNKMRKGNDQDTPFCSRLTILRIFGGMCVKKDGKTGDLYPLPCFAAPSFAHDCAKPA